MGRKKTIDVAPTGLHGVLRKVPGAKTGILYSESKGAEKFTALEVKRHGPWSVDFAATNDALGLGVARDLVKRPGLSVGAGVYGMIDRDREAYVGVGITMRF